MTGVARRNGCGPVGVLPDFPGAARMWGSPGVAGGRRLVCVSGLGGNVDEWAGVGPGLAAHGEVVAVEAVTDGPGAGDGPLRAGVIALDPLLADSSRPCVLVGHSMGGVICLLTAAAQPDRLAGLILTSPFLPVGRGGRSAVATAVDYAHHRLLFASDVRNRRRSRPARGGGGPHARAAGLRALAYYGLRPAAFHAVADQVTCPVLLVHGDDDHYVPPAFAGAAASRHPDWGLDLIAGAGHFPHRDDPTDWLARVDPWLRRLRTP